MTFQKAAEAMSGVLVDALANGHHTFITGPSPAMRALERTIQDIAASDIPVLIVGESGVGKEAVAMQLHRLSSRRGEPFLRISCAGLHEDFFRNWQNAGPAGNETGPVGSVFLDEIHELDFGAQPALLRCLSESNGHRWPAARVITAASRNLEDEIRAGHFREELYYRIAGLCLRLPPLRQRKEDIPALVEHFLSKHSTLLGRPRPALSGETLPALMEYSWPGNVRELEYVVRNIIALGDERRALAELGKTISESRNSEPAGISLKEAARAASRQAERELILKVLAQTRWNRKRAAQQLQISYKALLYKLKQLELEDSEAY